MGESRPRARPRARVRAARGLAAAKTRRTAPTLAGYSLTLLTALALLAVAHGVVVTDEITCRRVGAPQKDKQPQVVGCDWNPSILESRHVGNSSCEPSQVWINASGLLQFDEGNSTAVAGISDLEPDQCRAESNLTCEYSAQEKCLLAQDEDSECYTPPLQLLREFLKGLVATFPKLHYYVEELPRRCAEVRDNVTCTRAEGCVWNPNNLSLVRPGTEDEVQTVTVLQAGPTQPQVQLISLTAAEFDRSVVTVSLTSKQVEELNFNSSYFRLQYNGAETGNIGLDATADELAAALEPVLLGPDLLPVDFDVRIATTDTNGLPMSWEVSFTDPASGPSAAQLLGLSEFEVEPANWPVHVNPVILTRHRHNMQRLVINSPGEVTSGDFILKYRYRAEDVRETAKLSFNASADDIREALLEFKSAGTQALAFVAVALDETKHVTNNSTLFEADNSTLFEAGTPWRAWNITFAAMVNEYELSEYLLVPGYKRGVGLHSCEFCSQFVDSTGSEATVPSVHSLVNAPRISGWFETDICRFRAVVPGLVRLGAQSQSTTVPVQFDDTLDLREELSPGDYIRVAGEVRRVTAVRARDIEVDSPFNLNQNLPRTVNGSQIFRCVEPTFDVEAKKLSTSASAADLEEHLNKRLPFAARVSEVSPANKLGERAWKVTFEEPLNSLDPLMFNLPAEFGWAATSEVIELGVAAPSGSFRLAYTRFDSPDVEYERMFTESDLVIQRENELAGSIVDGQGTLVAEYTRPIPLGATAVELRDALEELDVIMPGSVKVSRSAAAAGQASKALNATASGVTWTITFLSSVIAFGIDSGELESLTANVPPLAVADEMLLDGTDTQVYIQTVKEGSGNLTQTNITEYVTDEGQFNSPCEADEEYRDARVVELGIDNKKLAALHELDANLKRCAGGIDEYRVWHDHEECKRVLFSNDLDPSNRNDAPEDGEEATEKLEGDADETTAYESFCVWRGPSRIQEDLPASVDPAQVVVFAWTNSTYGGVGGVTRYSNCTVPILYQAQQLLKLFGVSEEFVKDYLQRNESLRPQVDLEGNSLITERLSLFIEQFNKCYEDIQTIISLPSPTFIKLWQTIIVATCYTVSLWYGLAAAFFTYRMRKLRILSPKSIGSAIVIVFCGFFMGVLVGVFMGCIPAAVLTNIYSSIPHNLPLNSANSLGIAQGLLIIYFDFGRGLMFPR